MDSLELGVELVRKWTAAVAVELFLLFFRQKFVRKFNMSFIRDGVAQGTQSLSPGHPVVALRTTSRGFAHRPRTCRLVAQGT